MRSAVYEHAIAGCLAADNSSAGVPPAVFARTLARAAAPLADLRAGAAAGAVPFLRLPRAGGEWRALTDAARDLKTDFDRLVVIGTGGSSLGGQALAALSAARRVVFLDNVDAESFERAVGPDAAGTAFLAISKSGATMETVALVMAVIERLRRGAAAADIARRVAVLTAPGDNPLGRLAQAHGFARIDHPPGLGGRYAAFSAVGLIPALVAGLDAEALAGGARGVVEALGRSAAPAGFAAAEGAAIAAALAAEAGASLTVTMAYADRLAPFGHWLCQLVAESLGKDGRGLTPLAARGSPDQHSQLQLYLDGPGDKMFTLIGVRSAGTGAPLGRSPVAGLDYLAGRRLGDVLWAEFEATAEALCARARPVRTFCLPRLDEESLGALMMHFMIETVLLARLFAVDPFDQPAVEDGKRRARAKF